MNDQGVRAVHFVQPDTGIEPPVWFMTELLSLIQRIITTRICPLVCGVPVRSMIFLLKFFGYQYYMKNASFSFIVCYVS